MKGYVKVVVSLTFLFLIAFGLFSVLQWDLLKIQEITLESTGNEGEQLVLYSRIAESLKDKLDQKIKGQYFWQVNLKEVMELIESDRRVQEATVRRSFPHSLAVELKAHRPVLTLLRPNGRHVPIAKDASLLPETSDFPDLPILRGIRFLSDDKMRAEAVRLVEELPASGPMSPHNISELTYDKEDGWVVRLIGESAKIKLGHEDFVLRSSLVERVLDYLESQQLQARVIDARFSKKVVVRLRNAP